MPQIKVFVINLKRSKDRRKYMEELLSKNGVRFEWVEACDGNEILDEEIEYIKELNQKENYVFKKAITKFSLACSKSHLRVYQRIVEEKINWGCVLEDDIALGSLENFKFLLAEENLLKINGKVDLIYLYANAIFKEKLKYFYFNYFINLTYLAKKKINQKFYLKKNRRKYLWGAAAYILNQKAAQRLLQVGLPARRLSDHLIAEVKNFGIEQRVVTPNIIHINYSFPSFIRERKEQEAEILSPASPNYTNSYIYPLFYLNWNLPLDKPIAVTKKIKRRVYQILFIIFKTIFFKSKKRALIKLIELIYLSFIIIFFLPQLFYEKLKRKVKKIIKN